MPAAVAPRTIALTLVGLLVGVGILTAPPAAAVNPDPNRTLVWSDEFDGPAGAAPDPARWRHDVGGWGWGNQELQYYTDGNANTFLDGQGRLAIEARNDGRWDASCAGGRCAYTSGRLLTQGTFAGQYGRYEARIKVPRGQGLWPAFWMLGDDIETNPWPASGEIDIMEHVGHEPGTVWGSIHGPDNTAGGNTITGSHTLPGGAALADDFHVYAIEWEPEQITWYLDGQAFLIRTPADMNGGAWVYDKPFFILLNLAVGGVWPGSPNSSTQFPQRMLVDYVRVYDLAPAPSPTPTPSPSPTPTATPPGPVGRTGQLTGYAGKCIDVENGAAVPGTGVHSWDCYSSLVSQQWTRHPDGTIRSLGLCLDTADRAVANGTRLRLATCDGGATQQFALTGGADLVNRAADRCVDVADWNPHNGATLQLWDCAGTANQKWWER